MGFQTLGEISLQIPLNHLFYNSTMIQTSFPLLLFISIFAPNERHELLKKRLEILQKYRIGIEKQVNPLWENEVSAAHVANVKRMIDIVDAEITGTKRLLANNSKEQI